MKGYWSTLGIVLGLFLILDGLIGWFLGIEYSDPVRHSITVPLARLILVVSPILVVGGIALFFVSLVTRRREKPPPPPPVTPPEIAEFRKKRAKTGQREERIEAEAESVNE